MTVKDQFDVRGFDSTIGYVGRAFRPASDDAVLVAMLRQLGAVFLAKTNLPQSIMVGQPFSLHILPAHSPSKPPSGFGLHKGFNLH
jgi:Asp-tRNA(Asn)/Glu-tRNA(Gln) amidotransferase A subunit family amidase